MAVAARQSTGRTGQNVVAQARGKGSGKGSGKGGGKRGGGARARSALWENVKALGGAILIYLVIRTFFVEAYRIPSGSMIPTLQVGDWLFVNKLVYGPHLPFTDVRLPGYRQPMRSDVVVFESPYQADEAAAGADPTPTLVKRLVGVPGDTIYMRHGLLYVNGLPQRQGFATAQNPVIGANSTDPLMTWQHTVEVHRTRFGEPPATPTHDDWGPLLIPAAHYFMMGDNRYCSKDSRYWGLVPRDNIRGRPLFVYYSYRPGNPPSECDGDVSERPLPFITDIRWGRIGTLIR